MSFLNARVTQINWLHEHISKGPAISCQFFKYCIPVKCPGPGHLPNPVAEHFWNEIQHEFCEHCGVEFGQWPTQDPQICAQFVWLVACGHSFRPCKHFGTARVRRHVLFHARYVSELNFERTSLIISKAKQCLSEVFFKLSWIIKESRRSDSWANSRDVCL